MKKHNLEKIFFYLAIVLITMCPLKVRAESITTAPLKEVYLINKNGDDGGQILQRFSLVDEKNNIYMLTTEPEKYVEGSYAYVSSPYQCFATQSYGLSGILSSDTAKIASIKSWTSNTEITTEQIHTDKAYCLPDEVDSGFYSPDESKKYPGYIETKGNAFNTDQKFIMLGADGYFMTIHDKGEDTTVTLLTETFTTDYTSYDIDGHWKKDIMADVYTDLVLYDGTDGAYKKLENAYQYGKNLSWQTGKMTSGIQNGIIANDSDITIPASVKSIRLSYSDEFPNTNTTKAVSLDLGKSPYFTQGIRDDYDYHYYRNKSKMVSINGGEWKHIHNGEISPELPLRKGLNIVLLAGTDTVQEGKTAYDRAKANNGPSYFLLLYWDGEDGYEVKKGQEASIKKVDIYQAAYNYDEALDKYAKIPVTEKDGEDSTEKELWIEVNSSEPYIWIDAVASDSDAVVEIDNSTRFLNGYYKILDTTKDYFDIKVTSGDGKTTNTKRIYISWKGSKAELKDLNVLFGGNLETAYNPATRTYYCEKNNGASTLTFSYTPTASTTVDVFVDRQKEKTLTESTKQYLRINSDTKEIQWRITSDSGKVVTYAVYIQRGEEKGVSDETKQRAKTMFDKMVANGYLDYLRNVNGYDYWKTFGAASFGEEYLEGMLGYDVTKHNYKQASDYAAVILELVMSGENPYDYLGVNYVEKLLECDSGTGDFGLFSCNIWSLAALEAAGMEAPQGLVKIVKRQVLSETFDLDMRGWAMYAFSPYLNTLTDKEYARCIQSIKEVQIQNTTDMNGIDVTGCFENSFYTNRNIMSHGCMVTGLTSWGIDLGAGEFDGENGSDPVSVLENYQVDTGGWFYSPENPSTGGWNKDAVIAVGDLLNGSNVYQRYFLTEDKYKELVEKAKQLLEQEITSEKARNNLQAAYDEAKAYVSKGTALSHHGKEFYALQDAVFAGKEEEKPDVFLGTAEEREQVKKVKEAIASIESYSYADKDKLDKIKKQYEALKEERLFHYITNIEVLDNAYEYVDEIDSFLSKVDKIGKVSWSKTAKVEKARAAYEAFDAKQKEEKVVKDALATLLEAEKIIEAAKTADKVVQAIENLGQIITLNSRDDIESVRAAYDGLTEEEKKQVVNLEKLEKAENEISKLLQAEKDKESASEVTELIESIGTVNQNSAKDIAAARQAYDSLENEQQKQFVSNYSTLLEAEIAYNNLTMRNELVAVMDMAVYNIEQLEEAYGSSYEVNETNYAEVKQAAEKAEAYVVEQEQNYPKIRNVIENYTILTEAKGKLAIYETTNLETVTVEDFVHCVEQIGTVTLDSEAMIQQAYAIYERLGITEQEEVAQPYEVLQQADDSLVNLKNCYSELQETSYAILSIGTISLSDTTALNTAQEAYDAMSDEAKQLIDEETVAILNQAIQAYNALTDEQDRINQVMESIEKAAEISDLSGEENIANARKAYESLDKKEMVTNYLTLVETETLILNMKKEVENEEIAGKVAAMIEKLASVTDADMDKIKAARVAYEALTDSQKILIGNISVLEQAESKAKIWEQAVIKLSAQNITVQQGETTSLKVEISAEDMSISWASSNSSIVSVKDGIVTGVQSGTAIVTASLFNGNKAECKVTVQAKASETPADTSNKTDNTTKPNSTEESIKLSLNKSKVTVYVSGLNHTNTLTAYVDGKKINSSKISWKSSKPSVASVSQKGVVTGKKKGTAVITASYKGKSIACKVTVKKLTRSLNVSKATMYTKGIKHKITLSLKENGSKIKASKVTWKSSKKSVVSVSKNGVITGKKTGTATISAKYKGKNYTCKIKVKKPSFKLKKTKATIKKGKQVTIKSSAAPKATVKYASMNKKIATVSKKGIVTGKKKGTTKVKVTCNGMKRYFVITVK